MELSRWALKTEALFLLLALMALYLPGRTRRTADAFWWLSALAGFAYAALRYWASWPMTPLFAGSTLYAPLLPMAGTLTLRRSDPADGPLIKRWLVASGLLLSVLSICFPKDFYLPIIKTTALAAHGVLLFGSLGRTCFFVAGAWACCALDGHAQVMPRIFRWTVWGFGLWTLSLFCGELWSYSGWGVPMVWEDASTLTAIATWLFYVGLIHLHLGGLFARRLRAAMSIVGTLMIIALNGVPDLGPWRTPFSLEWRL